MSDPTTIHLVILEDGNEKYTIGFLNTENYSDIMEEVNDIIENIIELNFELFPDFDWIKTVMPMSKPVENIVRHLANKRPDNIYLSTHNCHNLCGDL